MRMGCEMTNRATGILGFDGPLRTPAFDEALSSDTSVGAYGSRCLASEGSSGPCVAVHHGRRVCRAATALCATLNPLTALHDKVCPLAKRANPGRIDCKKNTPLAVIQQAQAAMLKVALSRFTAWVPMRPLSTAGNSMRFGLSGGPHCFFDAAVPRAIEEQVEHYSRHRSQQNARLDQRMNRMRHPLAKVGRQ